MGDIAVAIPVRSFMSGKTRLMAVLTVAERQLLIRNMLGTVVRAVLASGVAESITIISSDDEVLEFADSFGPPTTGIRQPGTQPGLIAAASFAHRHAIDTGARRWLFLFGDLPVLLPDDVRRFAEESAPVVIATDWTGSGTNGLMLALDDPRTHEVVFAYGPGSRWLHEAEAQRLGIASTTVVIEGVAHDLDTVEDFSAILATGRVLPPELSTLPVLQQEKTA
jgi:2-phospho-L-lactate guanylyltransferase